MKVKYTVEIEVDQALVKDGGKLSGLVLQAAIRDLFEGERGESYGFDGTISVRVISSETLLGDVKPQAEWWNHASHAYPVATCHLCQQHK